MNSPCHRPVATQCTTVAGRGLQAGLTLIELMISITLGMLVVAAAISLMLSTKSSYTIEDDTTRLLDTGRYAIESVTRAVRLAAFENLISVSDDAVPIVKASTDAPNIQGYSAQTFAADAGSGLPARNPGPSDILQIRFFGTPDGTTINCAGVTTAPTPTPAQSDDGRGWSIFYVREVAGGEPELRCAYLDSTSRFVSNPIASGIESFRVLYGIDLDGDGVPDRFASAADLPAIAPAPATPFSTVVAVKISILARGTRVQRTDAENVVYELFGPSYPGAQIPESTLLKSRTRKVFSTVIQLRNRPEGGNIKPLP